MSTRCFEKEEIEDDRHKNHKNKYLWKYKVPFFIRDQVKLSLHVFFLHQYTFIASHLVCKCNSKLLLFSAKNCLASCFFSLRMQQKTAVYLSHIFKMWNFSTDNKKCQSYFQLRKYGPHCIQVMSFVSYCSPSVTY